MWRLEAATLRGQKVARGKIAHRTDIVLAPKAYSASSKGIPVVRSAMK